MKSRSWLEDIIGIRLLSSPLVEEPHSGICGLTDKQAAPTRNNIWEIVKDKYAIQ